MSHRAVYLFQLVQVEQNDLLFRLHLQETHPALQRLKVAYNLVSVVKEHPAGNSA